MSECLFCKIVEKQIKANVVYEDGKVMAFRDVNPQAPTHILVIPKKHIERLSAMEEAETSLLVDIHQGIRQVVKQENLAGDGYRVVNNDGKLGGQTVGHLHYHVLGGRPMKWPPG